MSSAAVLVTDSAGGDVSVIEATLASYGVSMVRPEPGEDWLAKAHLADGLIVNLVPVDRAALGRLTRCRVIARLGVGIDNIDLAEVRARGIAITHVPDYCREEVSDHALALLLASVRKLSLANADVHCGIWNQLGYRPIRRLSSLTLGLVGFGRLAQAFGRKAIALGMRVIAHDPYAASGSISEIVRLSLHDLLQEADVVSLHVPLTAETRGLIGRAELGRMKPGAILINTSRGQLIDEAALAAALDEQHLSAAALDVLETEPILADSPLRGRSNVLLTPHLAFYSEESLIDLQRTAAEDTARVLTGQTPHYRAV